MTALLLPVTFMMSKVVCRMNSMLFLGALTPGLLWLQYASLLSGPLLPLSHPSTQLAPDLPAIHNLQSFSQQCLKEHA
eukprot:scaffold167295_cov15-Tisochrysis_lutea.AAC.1